MTNDKENLARMETDDAPCTDCDDTGWMYQTERYCTCAAGAALTLPETAAEAMPHTQPPSPEVEAMVERLEKVESSRPHYAGTVVVGVITCWYRNPDGPEAAAMLRRLAGVQPAGDEQGVNCSDCGGRIATTCPHCGSQPMDFVAMPRSADYARGIEDAAKVAANDGGISAERIARKIRSLKDSGR